MCLVLFALDAHPRYRLVLAANRDEFYARPTAAASFWADAPQVLAGRDLRGGGTWLGVTTGGRWAAVTNYRDTREFAPGALSRGRLVSDFLVGNECPRIFTERLTETADLYNGFNLLVGEGDCVVWFANRDGESAAGSDPASAIGISRGELGTGLYGLSNHLLDTPWPKVARGKEALADLLRTDDDLAPALLLEILLDRTYAAEHEIPRTGLDPSLERALSARFIVTAEYGTRSSTALLIEADGRIHFHERSYGPGAADWSEARFELAT